MRRNIEIKARTSHSVSQRGRASALAGGPPEIVHQEDTFFRTARGRLKLREFAEDAGELIYYERPDVESPAESRYLIIPTGEPGILKEALSKALGVLGTVVKRREVYVVDGTRVHIDDVEGLGEFIELEAVLASGESGESGEARVGRLAEALGIEEADLVDTAYVDLMEQSGSKDGHVRARSGLDLPVHPGDPRAEGRDTAERGDMEDWSRHTEKLAGLETFDPAVFSGDEDVPSEVCNFVLSLALIWNDCKDVTYTEGLLRGCEPSDPPGPTREWGAYGGADLHVFRYQVHLVHELLTLLCRHQSLARSRHVDDLVRRLPDEARDAWYSMLQVALGSVPTDPFGQCLVAIRNTLEMGYDLRAMQVGYRNHFFGERREDDNAFVSRGPDAASTRFYFADAAAFGYLREVPGGDDWDQMREDVRGVLRYMCGALRALVDGFIRSRASSDGVPDRVAAGGPRRAEF
jgi:predicted adenylyl cyclase CyaB